MLPARPRRSSTTCIAPPTAVAGVASTQAGRPPLPSSGRTAASTTSRSSATSRRTTPPRFTASANAPAAATRIDDRSIREPPCSQYGESRAARRTRLRRRCRCRATDVLATMPAWFLTRAGHAPRPPRSASRRSSHARCPTVGRGARDVVRGARSEFDTTCVSLHRVRRPARRPSRSPSRSPAALSFADAAKRTRRTRRPRQGRRDRLLLAVVDPRLRQGRRTTSGACDRQGLATSHVPEGRAGRRLRTCSSCRRSAPPNPSSRSRRPSRPRDAASNEASAALLAEDIQRSATSR